MPENPVEVVGDLLGEMANRVGEYSAIWQQAAERNARNAYDADDLASDVLRATGLAARDMANLGASFVEMLGGMTRPSEPSATPARKATAKKATAKKATAKKATAKKAAARKRTK
jgi:hypothetical protein